MPSGFAEPARRRHDGIFLPANLRMKPLLYFALFIQVSTFLFAFVAPFGADHSSSWGLDIDDLLSVAALFAMALLTGIIAAIALKRHALAAGQFVGGILAGVIIFLTK